MVSLFGVNFPAVMASALGPGLRTVTLGVRTSGARTPGSLTAGVNSTFANHSCRGVIEEYSDRLIDGTRIQKGDKRVLVLAGTLPAGVVPKADDRVTIDGFVATVIAVRSDPAQATYSCQVRGA